MQSRLGKSWVAASSVSLAFLLIASLMVFSGFDLVRAEDDLQDKDHGPIKNFCSFLGGRAMGCSGNNWVCPPAPTGGCTNGDTVCVDADGVPVREWACEFACSGGSWGTGTLCSQNNCGTTRKC